MGARGWYQRKLHVLRALLRGRLPRADGLLGVAHAHPVLLLFGLLRLRGLRERRADARGQPQRRRRARAAGAAAAAGGARAADGAAPGAGGLRAAAAARAGAGAAAVGAGAVGAAAVAVHAALPAFAADDYGAVKNNRVRGGWV